MEQIIQYATAICAEASLMFLIMGIMLRNINKKLDKIQSQSFDMKSEMKKRDDRIDHLYEVCVGILTNRPRH